MREAAAHDPSGRARGVESRRIHLDLPGLAGRGNDERLGSSVGGDRGGRRWRFRQARASVQNLLQIKGFGGGGVEEGRDERLARTIVEIHVRVCSFGRRERWKKGISKVFFSGARFCAF